MLDAELAPYGGGQRRRIRLSGERVLLRPRLAQTLALVVHELATNAAEYGALSTSEGRVAVTWTVEQQSDVPRLSLAWSEAGGPPVAPPSRRGFGTLLVERSVAYELDGDLRLEFLPPGVRCEITLLLP